MTEIALMIVFGLFGVCFLLTQKQQRPVLRLFRQWAFAITLAGLCAYGVATLEWSDRPVWLLWIVCFFSWLLIDTVYLWFRLPWLYNSFADLYPSFIEDTSNGVWPITPRMLQLREWLREAGFTRIATWKTAFLPENWVLSVVFLDSHGTTRLQVFFYSKKGYCAHYCLFASQAASSELILTDNIDLPYGGFYPYSWRRFSLPRVRSLKKLYSEHLERMRLITPLSWDAKTLLLKVNEEQLAFKHANREAGFLSSSTSGGKMHLSADGHYRLWKSTLIKKYLGIS